VTTEPDIGGACVVNSKASVPIALVVADHMNIIVTVLIGNTTIGSL
jgi:hypothetical protein